MGIIHLKSVSTQPGTDQLDAQRLWVKFRDADCGVYYSLTGGTMDMLNGSGCELAMTKERAESLEWVAQNGSE
ncbi:lysozyme inhibitor LprI family protein [Pseudomonas aeruginosa]